MENLFSDLIPNGGKDGNQFADLIPQESNMFADLISGVRSYFQNPSPTPDYLKMISGRIAEAYESKPVQDIFTTLQAAGEVPIAAVTGVGGFFAGKAGGLTQTLLGRPKETAMETEKQISEAIFIPPRTKLGEKLVETLFMPFTALGGFGKEAARLPAESWGVPERATYPVETAGELTAFVGFPVTVKLIKQSLISGKVTAPLVKSSMKEVVKEQESIAKIIEAADKVREAKPEVADKIIEKLQPRIDNLEKVKQSLADTGEKLVKPVEPAPEPKVEPPTPKAKQPWDNQTEEHFQKWLDNTVADADRVSTEIGIKKLATEHPDLIARGDSWQEMRSLAERGGMMKPPEVGGKAAKQPWEMTIAEREANGWVEVWRQDRADVPQGAFVEGKHWGTRKQAQAIAEREAEANRPLGELHHAYIQVKNPLKTYDGGFWEKPIAEAKVKGHDTVVYLNEGEKVGGMSYIPLSKEQVKPIPPEVLKDYPDLKPPEVGGKGNVIEKKTISQFTEEYTEGLGEEGAITIGGVEVKPKVVTPGTKDVSLPDFALGALHVADRNPVIAPIIKANIKAEQNTNNWIFRYSDRIAKAFDKVEKPSLWQNVFGRKGTDIKDIDLMIEGKKPIPTQLTGFVTDVKGILGEVKGEIIQKMKNDFRKTLTPAQRGYSLWVEGGKVGEEPKITVAKHSYVNKKGKTITVPEHTRPYPDSTKKAVEEAQIQFKEMEKWGIQDYFPHIFKGKYKYLNEDGGIIASGQTAKQAKANFEEFVQTHPETATQTFMFVNDFYDLLTVRKILNPELANPLEYLGTQLSRKEFFRLLNKTEKVIKEEIANAGVADIPNVQVDMSGVASFQKGTKYSGHFLRRKTSLRGEETDPFRALMSYVFSAGRKIGLEDAKTGSYAFSDSLPANMPNAKNYIKMQADNMSGRYNIIDKLFDETIGEKLGAKPFIVSRMVAKGVGLEAKLKLGYAPVKTGINRIGGVFHTVLQEGTKNYLEGRKLLSAKDPELMGRIESEGHLAGMEQLFAGEGLLGVSSKEVSRWRPLGSYQKAEVKNRSEALASAYSAGLKKFNGDKDAAWIYAVDSAQLMQGLYNTAAKPVLVRGPIVQSSYQFKQYLTNEMRFISQLTPVQWAGYIPGMVALAGTRGALLTIKSIIGIGVIGLGIDELAERLNRKAPRLHRGVFGLAEFDVSAPASWQVPSSVKDWIGVLPRDLIETGDMVVKGLQNNGWTDEQINDYVRQITPVAYNVFKGLQMLSEGVTKEGSKVIYKGGKAEGVINFMGAKSVSQSQASDSARYMNQQRKLLSDEINVVTDKFFNSRNAEEASNNLKELAELKNIQTQKEMNDLISGLKKSAEQRQMTEETRIFLTLPKGLKRKEIQRRAVSQ